jgi:transcriptional regulator with XRE-family HTH domain
MRKPNVNSRLARARAVTGLDQSAFAEFVGISEPQLAHMERGRRPLTADMAVSIAETIGFSSYWLLGGGDFKAPIALDGEEYTKSKFELARLLALTRRSKDKLSSPLLDQLWSEREEVMSRRADAWSGYLGDVLDEVFERVRGTEEVERLGAEILEALLSRAKEAQIPLHITTLKGVDDWTRALAEKPKGKK